MANGRKRKEANRNRMREQRAASREDSQLELQPDDSHDMQASSSTGKRPRLDSSADSSNSVQSDASTSCERARKNRANMTEEEKAAVRAKDAERKRKSRANQTDDIAKTDSVSSNTKSSTERSRRHRAKMTEEHKAAVREKNAEEHRRSRANKTDDQRAAALAQDTERLRQSRANMSNEMKLDQQRKNTSARQLSRSIAENDSNERTNLARRERQRELAEMRESFLTPPDSNATPRAQSIEEAFGIPFFQSTKGVCYCRTALNNALGGNVFSYESLGVANIDNVNIEMEETAIQASLESKGVRCDSMNNIRDLVLISEINSVGTWILRNNNTGGHYVVLKRLHIDGPLWLLDSAKQAPEITASYFYELTESLRNEDDLRNLFLLYIRFPDGYRPQCLREPSEVGIRRMITTAPSNDCFVLIDNSFKYF